MTGSGNAKAERTGLSVAGALWGIAFAALGLSALRASPGAAGIVSLCVVGHLLTALAVGIDAVAPRSSPSSAGRTFTIAVLGVILIGEGLGWAVSLRLAERDLALWFALGACFAAAAIAITGRSVPGDNVLGCQLFFHATILFPLLVSAPAFLLDFAASDGGTGASLGRTTMGLTVMVFTLVAIPLLFLTLMIVLAYNLTRPNPDRDLPWAVFVAHQAVFSVIVVRWAYNGL